MTDLSVIIKAVQRVTEAPRIRMMIKEIDDGDDV
jgi:hypothetical protein